MSTRALWAVRAWGTLCLAFFVVTKHYPWLDRACAGSLDHGGLFRECKVRDFKLPFPPMDGGHVGDSPQARILMMGDSMLLTRRGHDSLPRTLADRLGEPVAVRGWTAEPECLIGPRTRVLVIESTERYLVGRLGKLKPVADCESLERETLLARLKDKLFTDTERNHRLLLNNSRLTAPLWEAWNTGLYRAFGRMPESIPAYSKEPPFLFTSEEAGTTYEGSFYKPHPDALVQRLASNLAAVALRLRARGVDVLFMPVPGSYTLYHELARPDAYDGFVPRLCDAVERKGIRVVRLYEPMRDSPVRLFFPTDTHWNGDGARLAARQLIAAISRRAPPLTKAVFPR